MVLIEFTMLPFINKSRDNKTHFFNYKLFINSFYSPTGGPAKCEKVGSRTSVPVSQSKQNRAGN